MDVTFLSFKVALSHAPASLGLFYLFLVTASVQGFWGTRGVQYLLGCGPWGLKGVHRGDPDGTESLAEGSASGQLRQKMQG